MWLYHEFSLCYTSSAARPESSHEHIWYKKGDPRIAYSMKIVRLYYYTDVRGYSNRNVRPTTTVMQNRMRAAIVDILTKYMWYFHVDKPTWWRFLSQHDDVIKWKHFPRYWPFVRGINRSPVDYPHKGQCRGALMLFDRDLRRNRTHYCVSVIWKKWSWFHCQSHPCCLYLLTLPILSKQGEALHLSDHITKFLWVIWKYEMCHR